MRTFGRANGAVVMKMSLSISLLLVTLALLATSEGIRFRGRTKSPLADCGDLHQEKDGEVVSSEFSASACSN